MPTDIVEIRLADSLRLSADVILIENEAIFQIAVENSKDSALILYAAKQRMLNPRRIKTPSVMRVSTRDHGNPVVIDLDDFATGPREWDLIQTAIYYDRFGWHTREEYRSFTHVYGYDIIQWPG